MIYSHYELLVNLRDSFQIHSIYRWNDILAPVNSKDCVANSSREQLVIGISAGGEYEHFTEVFLTSLRPLPSQPDLNQTCSLNFYRSTPQRADLGQLGLTV